MGAHKDTSFGTILLFTVIWGVAALTLLLAQAGIPSGPEIEGRLATASLSAE